LGPILNPLLWFKEIITFAFSNLDYCLIATLNNVTKNGRFDDQLHSNFFKNSNQNANMVVVTLCYQACVCPFFQNFKKLT
jgi:hypothetical protein